MKVQWSAQAKQKVVAVGRYISRRNPQAAREFISQLRIRVHKIPPFPLSGRVVPELGREDIREVIVRNYRIVYLVKDESIEVITLFEAHQLFPFETFKEEKED